MNKQKKNKELIQYFPSAGIQPFPGKQVFTIHNG